MAQKYRAQILLEPEQRKILAEIALRENRSVSDVVREAVAEYVTAKMQQDVNQRRRRALEKADRLREKILKNRGGKPIEMDFVEMLNQMRDERTHELLNSGR